VLVNPITIRSRPRRPLILNYKIILHHTCSRTCNDLEQHQYIHIWNHSHHPISVPDYILTLCDKVCQWLVTGRWFSPGTPVSSINKTNRHDLTDILLKVVLNTKNQTSVKSWRLVLLMEETGVPGENHRPVTSHWQTLSHIVVSSTPHLSGIWTHNFSLCLYRQGYWVKGLQTKSCLIFCGRKVQYWRKTNIMLWWNKSSM
jgi:hypothetical protein